MDETQFQPGQQPAAPQMSDGIPAPSELTGAPESQQPEQPGFDPAELEALRAEKARIEAEAAQVREQNRRYEMQMAQQAAAAWQQAEAQMQQAVAGMDYEEGLRVQRDFYKRQQAALLQTVQQRDAQVHQANLAAWIDHNVREHGLTDADRMRLAYAAQANPDLVPQEAQRIKAERQGQRGELDQTKAELEQMRRALAAAGIKASGAWQTGGANPQPVAVQIEPGSLDDFKRALAGSAGIPR